VSIRIAIVLLTAPLLLAQQAAKSSSSHDGLSAFVGHWQGSSNTRETKMSKPDTTNSVADCRWSPQQRALICEQTITDSQGKHSQFTIFMPNDSGSDYSFYTITAPGRRAYLGGLTIHDNVWTYGPPPDAKNDLPLFRTTNTFTGDLEVSKTEFTEDGKEWTTMLEGQLKRTNK
jgi:hypothetical protein